MIDIHIHLDGSLSPRSAIELAKMQGIELPTTDLKEIKNFLCVPANWTSLTDFLKCFKLPLTLLQTKEAIALAVKNLLNELKDQGLKYAEIRFAPQLHTQLGLTQEEVIKSAIKGLNSSEFKAQLILCCMRNDNNKQENIETIHLAKKFLNNGVCAIDLAGAESLYSTDKFKDIFAIAKAENIPFTIHAGEADGPISVRTAIEMGVCRIGHGVHSIEDENLVKLLAERQIPLEVCLTSNFQTCSYTPLTHPVRKLLDAGVKVTINSDNMTASDTTLKNEFEVMKKYFGLTKSEMITLLNNSIDASFLNVQDKNKLKISVAQQYTKREPQTSNLPNKASEKEI